MGINGDTYFYHATTRKLSAVFGALFNNIKTARKLSDGTLTNVSRVPLSYGPRSKFLTRINEGAGDSISIKLPRMSYEITDMAYDSTSKINSTNRRKFCVDGEDPNSAYVATPYNLTFELNIFTRSLDDVLQIVEQILPIFTPDYTVSIKGVDGPDTTTDIPFVLSTISMSDEYEGEFQPTRPIIYTLTFNSKVNYLGSINSSAIIKRVEASLYNLDTEAFIEKIVEKVDDPTSFISNINSADVFTITLDDGGNGVDYVVGENVIGQTSGYAGIVQSVNNDTITVKYLENMLELGEVLIGEQSEETYDILSIELVE